MAIETLVNVTRAGTPVASLANTPVRIVEISPIVIANSGGAIPANSLNLFSRVGVPDIRLKDSLTATDGTKYRVSGVPIVHDSSYLKVQIVKYVETTP